MSNIDTSTAAIEALMDGVTSGPWTTDTGGEVQTIGGTPLFAWPRLSGAMDDLAQNAMFCAAARELVPALATERDAAVARAERSEARAAELEAEVERLRAALGAEQDSADEMADVLSACGDGLMFDVDRLQAALDQHDALREAALSPTHVPSDAAAALKLLTAQARAQGMREAAEIAAHRYAVCEDAYSKRLGEEFAYRALEAKHIEDKILARAEEIEKEARNG